MNHMLYLLQMKLCGMNELKIFENKEIGISARTMLNNDGSISVNAEDTAIGFGWSKTEIKNGKQYTSIRWDRMNGFSADCGFPHEWSKEDYIPENLFYRLGMKASNARADKFQNWLAMEVIPQLRMTGTYSMNRKSDIEQGLTVVKFIADDMKVNDASRILMYENLCKDFNIPTGFLPKYEHNGSRQMKALSVLLKENGCKVSAVKFNQKLIEHGYLEEKERPSSKSSTKKFKALTEKGLKYGENAVNPYNQKEVQPLYYEDTFMQLYSEVV